MCYLTQVNLSSFLDFIFLFDYFIGLDCNLGLEFNVDFDLELNLEK